MRALTCTKTTVALATSMLSLAGCGSVRTDTDGVTRSTQAAEHAVPSSTATQIVPILDNQHGNYDLFISNNTGYRFTCTNSSGQTDLTGVKDMELAAGFTSSQLAALPPPTDIFNNAVQTLIVSSSSDGSPVQFGDLTTLDCHTPQQDLVEIDIPVAGSTGGVDRRLFVRMAGDNDPQGVPILRNVGCGSFLIGMGLNPQNPTLLPASLMDAFDVSDTYDINCYAGTPPAGYAPPLFTNAPIDVVNRGDQAIEQFTTSEHDLVPSSAQLVLTSTDCTDSSGAKFLTQYSTLTSGQGQWEWQVSGNVPYTFTNQTCTATYVLEYTLAGTPFQTAPATFTVETGCSVGTVTNCSGCGDVCAAPANATAVCEPNAAGPAVCSFTCNNGWLSAGVCACPSGETMCSSGCVNVHGSDADNCGACGHSCLQGTCTAGACTAWAVGGSCGGELAADANYLFWDASQTVSTGSVEGKKTAAGSPVFGVAGATKRYPTNVAPGPVLENGIVAWLGTYAGGDAVYSVAEGGTTGAVGGFLPAGYNRVGTIGVGGAQAIALGSGGTAAYVIAQENTAPWTFGLFECPLSAGSCGKLANVLSPPAGLGSGLGLYAIEEFIVGPTNAYFIYTIPTGSSEIVREFASINLSSKAIVTVSPAPPGLYGPLAIDANDVYFIENGQSIYRLPLTFAASSTPTLVTTHTPGITETGFSSDGTNVYFGSQSGTGAANLFYAPVTGGNPTPIYTSAYAASTGTIMYSYVTSVVSAGGAIYFYDSDATYDENDDSTGGVCNVMGIAAP